MPVDSTGRYRMNAQQAKKLATSDSQIGTPNGHYAPPAQGPFLCLRCIHFKQIKGEAVGNCDHPKINQDAKAGLLQIRNGLAVVHHEGCSDYFNPGPIKPTSTAHQ